MAISFGVTYGYEVDRQNAVVLNGLINKYITSCYRPEALRNQCTFFALMFLLYIELGHDWNLAVG